MTNKIDSLAWKGGAELYMNLELEHSHYVADESMALKLVDEVGGVEIITINLSVYGIEPAPGCFWIKNYSEHEGLGDALVEAGVVERTGRETGVFGPWDASADEYRLAPAYQQAVNLETCRFPGRH